MSCFLAAMLAAEGCGEPDTRRDAATPDAEVDGGGPKARLGFDESYVLVARQSMSIGTFVTFFGGNVAVSEGLATYPVAGSACIVGSNRDQCYIGTSTQALFVGSSTTANAGGSRFVSDTMAVANGANLSSVAYRTTLGISGSPTIGQTSVIGAPYFPVFPALPSPPSSIATTDTQGTTGATTVSTNTCITPGNYGSYVVMAGVTLRFAANCAVPAVAVTVPFNVRDITINNGATVIFHEGQFAVRDIFIPSGTAASFGTLKFEGNQLRARNIRADAFAVVGIAPGTHHVRNLYLGNAKLQMINQGAATSFVVSNRLYLLGQVNVNPFGTTIPATGSPSFLRFYVRGHDGADPLDYPTMTGDSSVFPPTPYAATIEGTETRANVMALPGNGAPGGTIRIGNSAVANGAFLANHIEVGNSAQIRLANGLLGPQSANPSYLGTDPDNDGLTSTADNCPSVPNVDQADPDQDGLGSACDNCPNVGNAKQEIDLPSTLGRACTTPPGAYCGNGIVEASNAEACDDGFANLATNLPCNRQCALSAPRITSTLSNRTIALGGSTTFSVTAVGAGSLTYQWQRNGQPIAGATTSTYAVTSATLGQSGTYSCVVTNAFGNATISASLTVMAPPPVITVQPVSQSVPLYATVTFFVEATSPTGGPLQYQWFRDGQPVMGANASSLTLEDVRSDRHGSTFAVGVIGAGSGTLSNWVTLSVEVPTSGMGTTESPYEIWSCDGLQSMRQELGAHYRLTSNVDCTGFHGTPQHTGFAPVGTPATPFTGSLDGEGFTVSNLSIALSPTGNHVGVFGVASGASVNDVGFTNVNIGGGGFVGGLVGLATGSTFERAFVTGTVSGLNDLGGLAGSFSASVVRDVYTRVNVVADVTGHAYGLLTGSDSGGAYERVFLAGTIPAGGSAFGTSSGTVQSQLYADCSLAAHACGGTWKTTAELQAPGTYAGHVPEWNFRDIWGFKAPTPSYPCLRFENGCGNPYLFPSGNGSEASPYVIDDCEALEGVSQALTAHFVLANDIDCAGYDHGDGRGFIPIGTWTRAFEGVLDGDGHVVRNLRTVQPSGGIGGLFVRVVDARLEDIGFVDAHVNGGSTAGVIASDATRLALERVFVTGEVFGTVWAGAFVARADAVHVRDAYAIVNVTSTQSAGLLAGHVQDTSSTPTTFENVYALGQLHGPGDADFGNGGPGAVTHDVLLACTKPATPSGFTQCAGSNATQLALRTPASYVESERPWDFSDTWGYRAPLPSMPCLRFEAGCTETNVCGDGVRSPGPAPAFERCDDGNIADGDACSSTCEPTALVVDAAPDFEFNPSSLGRFGSMGVDGNGELLFVGVRDRFSRAELIARRATRGGVLREPVASEPIVLDANLASLDSASPVVAGLPGGGFVVAWSAPRSGTPDIIARVVDANGTMGAPFVVNTTRHGAQERPSVTVTASAIVVAWTSHAATAADPLSGVLARRFDFSLTPLSGEIAIASSRGDFEQEVTVASVGDIWAAAWVRRTTAFAPPVVVWRRFDGNVPTKNLVPSPEDPEEMILVEEADVNGYPDATLDQPQLTTSPANEWTSPYFIFSARGQISDGYGGVYILAFSVSNSSPQGGFPIADDDGVREDNPTLGMVSNAFAFMTFDYGTPSVSRPLALPGIDGDSAWDDVVDVFASGSAHHAAVHIVPGGAWFTWTGTRPQVGDEAFYAYFFAPDPAWSEP